MKHLLSSKTTVYLTIHHSWFVENCKFHLVLIGSSLNQILQRLDKYHFTYQIVDCIYTLNKFRFYSNIISSRGENFNQLNCAVEHNLKCRIPKNYLVLQRNVCYEKNSKDIISVLLRSLRPLRLLDQLFGKDSKTQNSKNETDFLKIVDCFIDSYRAVNSERVNFSINN